MIGRYLHDHLFPTEEGVADEFAGAQRYWLLSVCHLCGLKTGVSVSYTLGGFEMAH